MSETTEEIEAAERRAMRKASLVLAVMALCAGVCG